MNLSSQNIIQLYFRDSRAANSVVGDQVWPKINLIQTFIVVLYTCKNDGDPSKNFSHYKSMEIFSDVQGQLTQ